MSPSRPTSKQRRGQKGGGQKGRRDRGGASRADKTARRPGRRGSGQAKRPRGLGGDQVEGTHAVRELLVAGRRRVVEVLVDTDSSDRAVIQEITDLARSARVPVHEVTTGRLRAEASTDAPQGVLARSKPLAEVSLSELTSESSGQRPFLVAFDGVTDPGNLGAALRSVECAGVSGVILPRHRAVRISPTAAKAAAGAIEYLSFALVGGIPAAIEELKETGVWVVGLDEGGDDAIHDLAVASEPVCLVLGAEGSGLGRLTRERCDVLVRIPLHGRLPSLNVSVAAALSAFEIRRAREGRR